MKESPHNPLGFPVNIQALLALKKKIIKFLALQRLLQRASCDSLKFTGLTVALFPRFPRYFQEQPSLIILSVFPSFRSDGGASKRKRLEPGNEPAEHCAGSIGVRLQEPGGDQNRSPRALGVSVLC